MYTVYLYGSRHKKFKVSKNSKMVLNGFPLIKLVDKRQIDKTPPPLLYDYTVVLIAVTYHFFSESSCPS